MLVVGSYAMNAWLPEPARKPMDLDVIGLIGIIPLATGIVGFCPLYRLLGLRTCAFNR